MSKGTASKSIHAWRIDKASIPTTPLIEARPNATQGFGRINLVDIVSHTPLRQYFNQAHTFTETDRQWTATYSINDPSQPVKVVLVWTDAPAPPGVQNPPTLLQNDLDLSVNLGDSPNCQTYAGNNMTASTRIPTEGEESASAAPGPERVVVGIYVTQIYDLDPTGGSFTASFWLWTRHRGGNIHPLDTVEIAGAKKVESEPTLTLVKAGQVWEQKFFRAVIRYAWELREYPFDEHNFVINFEEGLYNGDSVVYLPDRVQSGIDPAAMGSRWAIDSFHFDAELRKSPTTYGDPTVTKPKSYWAHGTVSVYAERRQTVIFWKLLIGAYVALLLALLSYRIKTDQPTLFSARLGLLVGSLFATVVNLRSTEAVLGRTDDFTLVDKIHITISLYILVAAISALISRHLCERDRVALSRTVDKYSLLVTAAIFLVVNILMISDAVISK